MLFRSSDASNWNTSIGDDAKANPYAIPLESAPKLIRYLKLTRADSGDYVIIPMSEARLGRNSFVGRYGWEGTGSFAWGGFHLGIYDTKSGSTDAGFTGITGNPFRAQSSYRGWGFGNKNKIDDQQMYAWNLDPIDKIVFEIAVTADDLTAEEASHLLKDEPRSR